VPYGDKVDDAGSHDPEVLKSSARCASLHAAGMARSRNSV